MITTVFQQRRGWLVIGVLTLVLAGCGGSSPSGGGPAPISATGPPPAAPPLAQICGAGTANPPATRHLDNGFQPVAAFDCETTQVPIPGQGTWNEEREGRATTELATLVKALHQPNKHRDSSAICTMQATIVEPFALEDATGHLARPSLPNSSCGSGSPQAGALNALNAVHWTTIATRRLNQVETQAEVTSGCQPSDDDEFAEDAEIKDRLTPTSQAPFPLTTTSIRVCVYRTYTDSSGEEGGRFVSGGTLTGGPLQQVLTGITGQPASTACKQPRSLYATLTAGPTQAPVQVELDGCLRTVHTGHVTNGVDPELVSQSSATVSQLLQHVGAQ